jgi:SMI1 / KNR4 family (SUKH-1)
MTAASQGADMIILDPGPPVARKQTAELEHEIGRSLPPSLRDFLLRYNGGRPIPKTFDVPGHEEHAFDVQIFYGASRAVESSNIGWASRTLRQVLGADRIAFGCTDTNDQLILDLRDGSVWFWDFQEPDPSRQLYYVAASHGDFLAALRGDD